MPPPAVLVPYLSSSLGAGVTELDMLTLNETLIKQFQKVSIEELRN